MELYWHIYLLFAAIVLFIAKVVYTHTCKYSVSVLESALGLWLERNLLISWTFQMAYEGFRPIFLISLIICEAIWVG